MANIFYNMVNILETIGFRKLHVVDFWILLGFLKTGVPQNDGFPNNPFYA